MFPLKLRLETVRNLLQLETFSKYFSLDMQFNFTNIVHKSGVADSQIDRNSLRKNVCCSKLILLRSLSSVEWDILLLCVVYLINDTYYYFAIPMLEWTYSFNYYLIAYAISLYDLDFCFIMSSEICKEYREYEILRQTPYLVIRTWCQL